MRVDIHTHAFHPKIAPKVLEQLEAHYGIRGIGSGLVEDLLQRAKKAGIDRVAVHCAATASAQVVPANNFAMALHEAHPEVIAFGTMHPEFADWKGQLERLRHHGIRGIKLHPDFQGFRLDDPRLLPFIEDAHKDFLFMVHIGDTLPPDQNPSCPYKLASLMDTFPDARFIAAHMGGYLHWEHALKSIIGRNVYIDTSSSIDYMDEATLRAIWKKHPRERILFGSDYPLFDPAEEAKKLKRKLKLSDAEIIALQENSAKAAGCM